MSKDVGIETQNIIYALEAIATFCYNHGVDNALDIDSIVEITLAWREKGFFQWNIGKGELSRLNICNPGNNDGYYVKVMTSTGEFDEDLTIEINHYIRIAIE